MVNYLSYLQISDEPASVSAVTKSGPLSSIPPTFDLPSVSSVLCSIQIFGHFLTLDFLVCSLSLFK